MKLIQGKYSKPLTIASTLLLLASCGSSDSNNAPIFDSDFAFLTLEDSAVSGSVSASDADNDALSFTVASAASNGVFELNADGSFTYTPNADYVGEDTVAVTVSDGDLTAETSVVFTVENVNDAPVLVTTNLTVSSQGDSTGQVVINDVDGDTVTITVTQAPEKGDLTLNSTTGEFTYTPNTLEQIDGSFTISYTDNIIAEALTATIDLVPSFETNADKLSYYYSSDKSHLKQAEAMQAKLEDDVAIDELSADLAVAYVDAGFNEKATDLLESIDELASKAEAYQAAAVTFDKLKDYELANALRAQAEYFYNQHMAEKGLDNINSGDAGFYLSLVTDYIDAGQVDESNALISTVYLYAEAVREEEYNTAYGRFLTAFRNNAKAAIEVYFASPTAENKTKAVNAAKMNAAMVDKTGYKVSGDTQHYKVKALYLAWAAEYLLWLDATEEAKEYTAKAVSLYTVADYDENYSYAEDENAANLLSYQSPLERLSGIIEALYPELETNPALALIPEDDKDYQDALEFIFAYQAINDLKAGATVTAALQPMRDYFTESGDLDDLYQTMVDAGSLSPHLAALLHYQGEDELAESVLIEALALLTSQAYIEEQYTLPRVTGTQGCYRLIELAQAVTGDASTYQQQCLQTVDTYFTLEAELYSTADAIGAYQQIIATNKFTQSISDVDALVTLLTTEIARFEDPLDTISTALSTASSFVSFQHFTHGNSFLESGFAEITTVLAEDSVTEETVKSIIASMTKIVSKNKAINKKYSAVYPYIIAIQSVAGQVDDYSTLLATAKTKTQTIVNLINKAFKALTENEQQGLMEDIIELNMYAGLTTEAKGLIESDTNTSADKLDFWLLLGQLYTQKDDFPATSVASVDTDSDGLANFFKLTATEEDITNSGLTADEDSDGDGVDDSEDSTPLGE